MAVEVVDSFRGYGFDEGFVFKVGHLGWVDLLVDVLLLLFFVVMVLFGLYLDVFFWGCWLVDSVCGLLMGGLLELGFGGLGFVDHSGMLVTGVVFYQFGFGEVFFMLLVRRLVMGVVFGKVRILWGLLVVVFIMFGSWGNKVYGRLLVDILLLRFFLSCWSFLVDVLVLDLSLLLGNSLLWMVCLVLVGLMIRSRRTVVCNMRW